MLIQMAIPVQGGLKQERKVEVLSNHLANAETAGFKKDILSFDYLLKTNLTIDYSQGDIKLTGNNFDLALTGKGFFKVETPNGIRYTRDGNFILNKEGMLVNNSGYPVLGEGGPITITEGTSVNVNAAGQIQVDGNIIGKVSVVNFEDLTKLKKEKGSMFVNSSDEREIPSDASVNQGALEMPNTNMVTEMTNMIASHRFYESYQKMLQTLDETDSKAINDVGKLG
ncbi:MAG: flagellar hook-basal body protein [Desulfobacterales bacterium]|nr:flagellar hook-basal body protein [Desulfobacterales bacterium]MBF0396188.1 flagellar hook-basal body protein [Desulfobacterales bacterium]